MKNGWILIDKPLAVTSHDVVQRVRRKLKQRSVGHTGTLDPQATGVLIMALGQACKLAQYVLSHNKTYTFTVRWGEMRSTDDAEGDVIEVSSHRPECAQIEAVLPQFIGDITQVPPRYSAIRVSGERAYKLARQNIDCVMPERTVRIDHLRLLDCQEGWATFSVACSSGTYVRSLARDLACALGTCGYVDSLRRDAVGRIMLEMCCSVDGEMDVIYPPDTLWQDTHIVHVTSSELQTLAYGQPLPYPNHALDGPLYVRGHDAPLPASIALWRDGALWSKRYLHGGDH